MSVACDPKGKAFCSYLSPTLIRRLSRSGEAGLVDTALSTAEAAATVRERRRLDSGKLRSSSVISTAGRSRHVYDMAGSERPLPGALVRSEGEDAVADDAVNEAYEHAGLTLEFYEKVMGWRSLDGRDCPLESSVHYGANVSNAFWDGTRMIYGDGDGVFFVRFTRSLAIVAHELSHGVVSYTSQLEYEGQAGALNESFCDVMGALVVQWSKGQLVQEADWTMGGEVLGPSLMVPGLRTFESSPAYSGHPYLGDDEQPKHMRDFVTTTDDSGGVHANSGIINHAFYRAAMAIGGHSWEVAGKIWFKAFVGLAPRSRFADAASAVRTHAVRMHGEDSPEAKAVDEAWSAVGLPAEVA